MSNQSAYCSKCGSFIEADCQFCTNCSEPKRVTSGLSPPPPLPHPWMQENSSRPEERIHRTEYLPPARYQSAPMQHLAQAQPAFAPTYPALNETVGVLPQGYVLVQQEKTGVSQGSLVLSILMLCLTVVALVPCLGWLNWVNLGALAEVQFILWLIGTFTERSSRASTKRLLAIPFVLIAVVVGTGRLILGGGCF